MNHQYPYNPSGGNGAGGVPPTGPSQWPPGRAPPLDQVTFNWMVQQMHASSQLMTSVCALLEQHEQPPPPPPNNQAMLYNYRAVNSPPINLMPCMLCLAEFSFGGLVMTSPPPLPPAGPMAMAPNTFNANNTANLATQPPSPTPIVAEFDDDDEAYWPYIDIQQFLELILNDDISTEEAEGVNQPNENASGFYRPWEK